MFEWMSIGSQGGSNPWGKQWFAIDTNVTSIAESESESESERPTRWDEEARRSKDMWFHGYWTYDWSDSYVLAAAVTVVSTLTPSTTAAPPNVFVNVSSLVKTYNYLPGDRVAVVNALCELDAPGEYYIDRATAMLSFIPPTPNRRLAPGDQLSISLLSASPSSSSSSSSPPSSSSSSSSSGSSSPASPVSSSSAPSAPSASSSSLSFSSPSTTSSSCLLCLEGVSHVTFQSIEFGLTRGDTVHVVNGSNVQFIDCSISNSGRNGILLSGVQGARVVNSTVVAMGCAGIHMEGGDLASLTPSNMTLQGNTISKYSRTMRSYNPGVSWSGVGHVVRGNHIFDAPHAAILGGGVNSLFEGNVVENVCYETSDAGAFYSGRNWGERGNVLRGNVFRSIRTRVRLNHWPPGGSVHAVYLDDEMSGCVVGVVGGSCVDRVVYVSVVCE